MGAIGFSENQWVQKKIAPIAPPVAEPFYYAHQSTNDLIINLFACGLGLLSLTSCFNYLNLQCQKRFSNTYLQKKMYPQKIYFPLGMQSVGKKSRLKF